MNRIFFFLYCMLASCRSILWLSPCLHLIRHLTWVEDEVKHSREKKKVARQRWLHIFRVVPRTNILLKFQGTSCYQMQTPQPNDNGCVEHAASMRYNVSLVVPLLWYLRYTYMVPLLYSSRLAQLYSSWDLPLTSLPLNTGRTRPFFWEKKSDHFIAKKLDDASVSIQKNNTDLMIN